MIYLGIDQSKRSTGCVWVGECGELVDYLLITPPKELDGVELIYYQWQELSDFLKYGCTANYALIEGLSFAAVGSGKDLLAGLNWYFRTQLEKKKGIFCGTVPVSLWRSQVLSKEEQRKAKAEGKDGLKREVVNKLPMDIYQQFCSYLVRKKSDILVAKGLGTKSTKFNDSLYDLADAYFIAQHCRKVERLEPRPGRPQVSTSK